MTTTEEDAKEQIQFEDLINGLIHNQYGCCNDFISESTQLGLSANLYRLNENGKLKSAGVGNNHDFHNDPLIRGDKINWLESTSTNLFEDIYLKKIGKFIQYLNSTCFTSILSFESHYAQYDQNSFYKRHIDQFKTEKGRKYSIILYLNQNWIEADGGQLSLYPIGKENLSILPLGGRLVFFRSDEMEHEVHPSFTRDRNSIVGWFKN